MDEEAVDFKKVLAAWAENERTGSPGHPSVEDLSDYRGERLAAPEARRVADHVALCRECFDLLPDLEAFAAAAKDREEGPADFEAATFWRTLRPRLEEEIEVRTERRPEEGGKRPAWGVPAALAAALVAALLGWTSWSQHRTILDLRSPRSNVEIYQLFEDTSVRSGATSAESISASGGGILLLTPHDPGSFADYEVQIASAEGDVVWSSSGFRPHPDDQTFSLDLRPDSLPVGAYRVTLAGVDAEGERHEIEEFAVQLEP